MWRRTILVTAIMTASAANAARDATAGGSGGARPALSCADEIASIAERNPKRSGYVVHEMQKYGGLGNKFVLLWRALEVALLLDRQLWVVTNGMPYLAAPPTLGGFLTWSHHPPPDEQSAVARDVDYSSIVPAARKDAAPAIAATRAAKYLRLNKVAQEFPGWRQDDVGFLPALPCIAHHVLVPSPAVDAQLQSVLNRSALTIAVHVRNNDADMMKRMSGRDDMAAKLLQSFSPFRDGRRLDELDTDGEGGYDGAHGRRLSLAFGLFGKARTGCDKDSTNLNLIVGCATQVANTLTALRGTGAYQIFEASDSSATDQWFRRTLGPGLAQSAGVPVHTGRHLDPSFSASLSKVYVDFFALARADAFISQCNGESTFTANAKLLRDAVDLPTYRAFECAQLQPYPAHTHVDWHSQIREGGLVSTIVHLPDTAPGIFIVGIVAIVVLGPVVLCLALTYFRAATVETGTATFYRLVGSFDAAQELATDALLRAGIARERAPSLASSCALAFVGLTLFSHRDSLGASLGQVSDPNAVWLGVAFTLAGMLWLWLAAVMRGERSRDWSCSPVVFAAGAALALLLLIGGLYPPEVSCPARLQHVDTLLASGRATPAEMAGAWMAACPDGPWTHKTIQQYIMENWHPGIGFGVASSPDAGMCPRPVRVGSAGDGGKLVCQPEELAHAHPCRVVAVGSRGETSFEAAIHRHAPHCAIDVFDGTLTPERTGQLLLAAPFATFHARNFYADTWKTLVHAHDGASAARGKPRYQIMKMDCEGCEFSSLAPWVANTCTEQLLIEVHGCRNKAPNPSTWKGVLQGMHHLMTNLSLAGYTPFYLETNLYARHGTCFEMALRRSEHHESGCAEPRAGALEGAASTKRARDAASQSAHGQGAHRTAG